MRNDIHDDDEEPTQTEVTDLELDGNVEAKIIYKQEAPMGEISEFKVLLELKGVGSKEGRLGVDLVIVLDVSGSMRGSRLIKMKLAMNFLIKKLGHTDRLSVVTFNRKADKLCPLRQINEESRTQIIADVNNLVTRSSTNTESGLRLALQILQDRTHSQRRRVAIMLMSDGIQDGESDAAGVPVSNVPVYTFAFGRDGDDEVLSAIAKNSNGGMFASVPDSDNLNVAFSTALAGLLHIAIEDLTLTIAPLNGSQLNEVIAGNYPQMKHDAVSITFGTLYDRETRRVLALLTLPKVEGQLAVDVFDIVYSYRVAGGENKSDKKTINVIRKDMLIEEDNEEVLAEERRVKTVSKMREARILADAYKLVEAREKLVDAKTLLSEVDTILTAQLDQLFLYMVSQGTYDEQGSAFALVLEASHEAQRATTVPCAEFFQAGMFNTPLMDLFIEQARSFDMDPSCEVPTEEDDNKFVALMH